MQNFKPGLKRGNGHRSVEQFVTQDAEEEQEGNEPGLAARVSILKNKDTGAYDGHEQVTQLYRVVRLDGANITQTGLCQLCTSE